MLSPHAAVPGPPVGFPAGLGGQVLGDVFRRVRGSRARGCNKVKFESCNCRTVFEMSTRNSRRKCWLMVGQEDGMLKMYTS